MEADLRNFLNPSAFKIIIEQQLGWILKDFKTLNGLAVVRPDFYPNNHVLGISKKAVIVCKGKSLFSIGNKEYNSIDDAFDKLGVSILDTFEEWEWQMEKEWVIMKDGEWVGSFTILTECPFRTKIRC